MDKQGDRREACGPSDLTINRPTWAIKFERRTKMNDSSMITKELAKVMESKITDSIKALITARDEAETKLYRIEDALSSQNTARASIERDLAKLIRESTDDLSMGKDDPSKRAKIRQLKSDLTEVQAWVDHLEGSALPSAKAAYERAQNELSSAIRGQLFSVKAEYEVKMNDYINKAMDIVDAWITASGALYTTLRANLTAGTIEDVPKLDGHSPRLDVFIRNTLGR
jgi:hypothetical protein